MDFNVKFGIGSKVWVVADNNLLECEVRSIHIYPDRVKYFLTRALEFREEKDCFVTKNELIEHLTNG